MSNSNTSAHLISVIIPIYNVEKYLAQCLASVQAQTYANLEIICVNDGSTDGSLAILEAHAAQDERITIVDKSNAGYGAACNLGLAGAHGDWISIVEPDDYLEPNTYEMLLAQADALGGNAYVDIVRSAYWRVFDGEKGGHIASASHTQRTSVRAQRIPCAYKGRVKPSHQPFSIEEGIELLLHHPSIWAAIYRREFLLERGIHFKEVPGAGWADNPFLVASHCAGARLAYVDRAGYCYREDGIAEARAFAERSPLTPLERWNDMMDEADRLHVTNKDIQRALTLRGITYALLTRDALLARARAGLSDKTDIRVHTLLAKSLRRMDAELVFSDARINYDGKALVAGMQELPLPKKHMAARLAYLAREGFYRIATAGLPFVFNSLKDRKKTKAEKQDLRATYNRHKKS